MYISVFLIYTKFIYKLLYRQSQLSSSIKSYAFLTARFFANRCTFEYTKKINSTNSIRPKIVKHIALEKLKNVFSFI